MKNNKKQQKNFGFAALLIVIGLLVVAVFNQPSNIPEISFTEVVNKVRNNEVNTIIVKGNDLELYDEEVADVDGSVEPDFVSQKEDGLSVSTELRERGIEEGTVSVKSEDVNDSGQVWTQVLFAFGPLVLFVFILFYFMKQAQGQGNQAMNFGKSRAKVFGDTKEKVTFSEVAGNEESKEELQEVVEFLKFPKKFREVGAKIPKGVLLVGSPGTGKTLMARAVAGEAGVPFFSISGSEFVEMFVGVGASRVRDLFAKAKKNSPCIIFIDEIDAVGRRRGSGMGGGHDEREQTLNQILVEMDGFEQGTNVIVIAATNRPDVLDPALLRPGRFDRRVTIPLPDRKDREAILNVHFKKKPTDKSVNLDALAAKTAGSSGADLMNIANESAILAARRNSKTISNDDVTNAFERVAIGPERKNKIMNEKDKELTAYHEAGHALVGHVLPLSDPIHKVTIIPRGGTGGVTWAIPPEDKSYHSINEYKDVLARILGGRIAEKIIYGVDNVTTGAGSDLKKAAELAREMVIEQGMGTKKLRNMVFTADQQSGMMFDRMVHDRPYSEETAREIDFQVEGLIAEAAHRAEEVIKANKKYLKALADKLLDIETVDEKQVEEVFEGTKMPKTAAI
ncbi:TPA: ATP-dependent zinc metalloprotease FtsH [Candidatus Saccharibacteria bacterium]|nr:ATP-dependent zinc metalloprotease FtsH [Candidatus Saccharibacteria bacterium]HIO87937.1 ATP-dependent zinc metalloprotease FtsH [Candidatus Saccharibacteria bacterium]